MAAIDVGAEAINRARAYPNRAMGVSKVNPANDSGTLDTVTVYTSTAYSPLKVGTFLDNGSNSLTTRDSADLGTPSIGLNTFTGLSIDVVAGDYLGFRQGEDSAKAGVDYGTGGAGYWYKVVSPWLNGTNTYDYDATALTMSVYATGETVAAGGGALVGGSALVGGKILCGNSPLIN